VQRPHNRLNGVIPPLVDMCVTFVHVNWNDFEFDFTKVAFHLRVQVCVSNYHSDMLGSNGIVEAWKRDYRIRSVLYFC
jgi:hypothetical protein